MIRLETAGRWLALALAPLLLALGGCATSVHSYDNQKPSRNQAVVLLGLDSQIPLASATRCSLCPSITFGGRTDVYAFVVDVGSSFAITGLSTYDKRVAAVNGASLKIDKPGIHYYGTIVGDWQGAKIARTTNDLMLLAARRKFGDRFDNLAPVDFSWPDPSQDSLLPNNYRISRTVQAALRKYTGLSLRVDRLAAAGQADIRCRMGGPLPNPDFLPYEEFVRRALNQELATAGLYSEDAKAHALSGTLTELSLANWSETHWKMGIRLDAAPGKSVSARTTAPYFVPSAANHGEACALGENAVAPAVAQLLRDLVTSKDFDKFMSELAAP